MRLQNWSSLFKIMSARGLKSGSNFFSSQFSNVIRLALSSNMLELSFLYPWKKYRRKRPGNRMIAFVRLSLERMGVQKSIEKSHLLFILSCWWKRRRDILSALLSWGWSYNNLKLAYKIKIRFEKSHFNVLIVLV